MLSRVPQFDTNVNTPDLWYFSKANSFSSTGRALRGSHLRQVITPPVYTCDHWIYVQVCVLIKLSLSVVHHRTHSLLNIHGRQPKRTQGGVYYQNTLIQVTLHVLIHVCDIHTHIPTFAFYSQINTEYVIHKASIYIMKINMNHLVG